MLLFIHPGVSDSVTPWTVAHQASLSLTISQSFPKFMAIALVMPFSHLILWRSLLLLPSVLPSISDFSNESSVCIKWPKYWSFSFSISLSSEYSGLISLKIGWLDLLAVQGTFSSLLQDHSSKASIDYTAIQKKVSFHSNPKERQCQRMLKLLHNYSNLTH